MECGDRACDFNYMRFVGWEESNPQLQKYYSPEMVRKISKKVTELTMGVDKYNRPIIIPDSSICEALDAVYSNYRPSVGDIFTRYNVPSESPQDQLASLIDQTVEIIVANIRNSTGMEQQNQTLSAWVQVYGDFNTSGLRQHPPIKVKNKRPSTMQFNMNY